MPAMPVCHCRMKGKKEECIKSLQHCDQPYSLGERNGCDLNINTTDNICILVETEAGMSTFEPVLGWYYL